MQSLYSLIFSLQIIIYIFFMLYLHTVTYFLHDVWHDVTVGHIYIFTNPTLKKQQQHTIALFSMKWGFRWYKNYYKNIKIQWVPYFWSSVDMNIEIWACKVHTSKLRHTSAILARWALYSTQESSQVYFLEIILPPLQHHTLIIRPHPRHNYLQ